MKHTAGPLSPPRAVAEHGLAARASSARARRGPHVERADVVRVYAELPAARAALRRAAVGALELARRIARADRKRATECPSLLSCHARSAVTAAAAIGRGLPGSLKGGSEITENYQEIPMEV